MQYIDVAQLPSNAPEVDLAQLLEAGCHFGHQSRRWHPKMKPWIYLEKDGVHIFDLVKTAAQLRHAYNYAYQLGLTGKTLVFIGTKRQARELVKTAAEEAGAMYIVSRWLGGLLTNWEQVKKSLKRMVDIEEGLQAGKFAGYTKFERVQLEKEATRLARFFGGLRGLSKQPDALFIVDPHKEEVIVREAKLVGVPIVAMVDTNTDPTDIDLPIPANDDAARSIETIVSFVAAGYQAGKKARK